MGYQPGISLCMITCDEEVNLARCLQSVSGLVDEIVIVDTGSRDNTAGIAQNHGALIFSLPWSDDFAAARNYSLEKASREWILCLDADEELQADRHSFRQLAEAAGVEGYIFPIENVDTGPSGQELLSHTGLRLWRSRPEYRFEGIIHEELLPSIVKSRPEAVIMTVKMPIRHFGYEKEEKNRKNKSERNIRLLEKAGAGDPGNLYYRYCLALEYYQHGSYEKAAKLFADVRKNVPASWPRLSALYRNYGICLLDTQQPDSALELLEDGIGRFPDYTDLYYLNGMVWAQKGRVEEAIQSFLICLSLGEAPAVYVTNRGVGGYKACYAAGRVLEDSVAGSEAAKAYTLALQYFPGHRPALHGLARVLAKYRGPAGCLSYLEQYFEFVTPSSLDVLLGALEAAGLAQTREYLLLEARTQLLKGREVLQLASRRFGAIPVIEKRAMVVSSALAALGTIT